MTSARKRIWIWRVKHGKSCGYRLHERTLFLYQRYLAVRPDDGTRYLFRSRRRSSRPLSGGEINRLFHKYATAADLPRDRAHVHSLRHSIAVHLAEIGWTPADVQYWLGHRDIKSTMVYFRITDKRADLFHEAMRQSDRTALPGRGTDKPCFAERTFSRKNVNRISDMSTGHDFFRFCEK
jgi:site-specific recombinase XerD